MLQICSTLAFVCVAPTPSVGALLTATYKPTIATLALACGLQRSGLSNSSAYSAAATPRLLPNHAWPTVFPRCTYLTTYLPACPPNYLRTQLCKRTTRARLPCVAIFLKHPEAGARWYWWYRWWWIDVYVAMLHSCNLTAV